jgi:uncharacterized heparinase superfamily protein
LRRFYETARHLHPEQMRFQVQRRLRVTWPRRPRRDAPRPLRLSPEFGWRVARCRLPYEGDVLAGEFRWWGREARLDLTRPWVHDRLGAPWSYLVQYCEYLGPLADRARAEPELAAAIARFVERWIDVHPPGTKVAWDPYPTALRIVSWLDVMQTLAPFTDTAWRQRVLESLYVQARWLSRNLERHLLGTHLLKDIRALLVAAACFDDAQARGWRRTALRLLERELDTQVDTDGAHAEPSLMYHCVALEDLLDLLNFNGAVDAAMARRLRDVARHMLRYARVIQTPDGGYPLLGDAWDGGAPSPRDLLGYARRLELQDGEVATAADTSASQPGMAHFAASGIGVWREAQTYLVADVGDMGTPHLSAHGHCDSLSFELWMDGAPWLVDSGTWSYEPGAQRHACRSTRAHNTLEVDGREQHEIWGAFRVARRSSVRVSRLSPTGLQATLVPWFNRKLRVQRRIEMLNGRVELEDRVEGPGTHSVRSRFHIHPDCETKHDGGRVVLCRGDRKVAVEFSAGTHFEVHDSGTSGSGHAQTAGGVRPNAIIVVTHDGALPYTSATTIRRA